MTGPAAAREQPAWYTPDGLPDELLSVDGSLRDTLDVGAPGKVGLLDLDLQCRGGVTRLQRHYQRVPLHVYRPIYLDENRPDMAFLFVQQFGDGLVQGDRYRIDVDCGPGTAAHITTQAATNVFGAPENFATQLVNLRVGAGSVLEYLPDPVIPFRGSRLFQRTCLVVDPEATVILAETVWPGRVAHREAHEYDFYWAETDVRRPDDTPLFADVVRLSPGSGRPPSSLSLLGPHDVLAALYVIATSANPPDVVELLRASLSGCSELLAGVSELPNRGGVVVKLLGQTSKDVQAGLRTAWNAARLELLGVPAPNLRKG